MQDTKRLDPIAVGIKRIIAQKGLVQKKVAFRAGLTEQQLSDMLNDRKIIRAVDLFDLADALGVEVQELYDAGLEGREEEVV